METKIKQEFVRLVPTEQSPSTIVKVEMQDDDDEDTIPCRLCTKSFMNPIALRNHVSMQHCDQLVDLEDWLRHVPSRTPKHQKQIITKEMELEIQRRTDNLVSNMKPMNILTLASGDVDYIIVKDEVSEPAKKRKRKMSYDVPLEKAAKEPEPITGPFECLEPSNLVADGTCHQIFFSCCEYSIHFRDEHTRRRKGIKCQVCEKLLQPGASSDEPFVCQVCGVGFKRQNDLNDHTSEMHVKLKPFQCAICQKRFTQQGGLQQHMRMHTGDRPFACSYCTKSFTQKSGLDQHLRIHTKVKPYRCVVCAKTFCQSVHLKQHMRTHTHVAPFQCVVCQKRFKQSSHLNYHLKHHNEGDMTEDQREKYNELVGMINVMNDDNIETTEVETTEATERIIVDNENVVIEQDREYILSDNGDETWSVQVITDDIEEEVQ